MEPKPPQFVPLPPQRNSHLALILWLTFGIVVIGGVAFGAIAYFTYNAVSAKTRSAQHLEAKVVEKMDEPWEAYSLPTLGLTVVLHDPPTRSQDEDPTLYSLSHTCAEYETMIPQKGKPGIVVFIAGSRDTLPFTFSPEEFAAEVVESEESYAYDSKPKTSWREFKLDGVVGARVTSLFMSEGDPGATETIAFQKGLYRWRIDVTAWDEDAAKLSTATMDKLISKFKADGSKSALSR